MTESDLQQTAPEVISPTRPAYWSVRRELWENRSIYIAPLIVAAAFLLGFQIHVAKLPGQLRNVAALTAAQQHKLIEEPYMLAALVLMGTTFIVAVFYCLDALHGERRDRSILFWKSLPVSDLTTVLSKASIPVLILPLLTFAIIFVTQCIMLLVSTAVILGSGQSPAPLWSHFSFFQMSLDLLYHLVAIHGFWYAPIFGWLMLVSAWARRATFLWAALPLLAIGIVEKIAFNTSYFGTMLAHRLSGGESDQALKAGSMTMNLLTPGQLLASPGLWIGLAITAAFLAAAVRLRRYRDPI